MEGAGDDAGGAFPFFWPMSSERCSTGRFMSLCTSAYKAKPGRDMVYFSCLLKLLGVREICKSPSCGLVCVCWTMV